MKHNIFSTFNNEVQTLYGKGLDKHLMSDQTLSVVCIYVFCWKLWFSILTVITAFMVGLN